MIWMLRSRGKLQHIKDMDQDQDALAVSVCRSSKNGALVALDTQRSNYWAHMMFIPQLGFAKCKRCLAWEENKEAQRKAADLARHRVGAQ